MELNAVQKTVIYRMRSGEIPFLDRGCRVVFRQGIHACNLETMQLLDRLGYVKQFGNGKNRHWKIRSYT